MHLRGRRKGIASVAVLLACAVTCIAAASPLSDRLSIKAAFLPPLPRAGAVPRAAAAISAARAVGERSQPPPLTPLRPRSKPFTLPAPRRPLPPIMARSTATRRGASDTAADESDSGSSGGELLLHAFTMIGKSTRWTVAGLVGVVLLVRR